MAEALAFGVLLRVCQAILQASPFVVCGLLVAAIFRRLLKPAETRALFGEGTRRALPQAWLVGMLLPVCSLGVIPVARELHRSKLTGGTILAFALAAPLFNPMSVLYGLSLSRPGAIVAFAMTSLIVVTAAGVLWDAVFRRQELGVAGDDAIPPGIRRIAGIAWEACREITGPTLGWLAIGLVGVVILAVTLPPGLLQTSMNSDKPFAPLVMAAVAVPAYVTPMAAMGQLSSIFQHGNSIAAGFVLLALGAGLNFGSVGWIVRTYGLRRGAVWFGMLTGLVLLLAVFLNVPLASPVSDDAGHTHAFDTYTRPFDPGDDLARAFAIKLTQSIQGHELVGVGLCGLMLVTGFAIRIFDRRERLWRWISTPPPATEGRGKFDFDVPPRVLGATSLLILIGISVAGCFVYYPEPDEVFEEIAIIRTEAITAARTLDRRSAEYFIPVYEDWVKRLQVGYYLRTGGLSEFKKLKAELVLDGLELLEHEIADGDREEIVALCKTITTADVRMRAAFLPDSRPAESGSGD